MKDEMMEENGSTNKRTVWEQVQKCFSTVCENGWSSSALSGCLLIDGIIT